MQQSANKPACHSQFSQSSDQLVVLHTTTVDVDFLVWSVSSSTATKKKKTAQKKRHSTTTDLVDLVHSLAGAVDGLANLLQDFFVTHTTTLHWRRILRQEAGAG